MTAQEQPKTKLAVEWYIINQLARSYLDLQKTRVGMDNRAKRMIEEHLISKDLAYVEFKKEKETEGGKVRQGRVVKLISSDDEDEQRVIDKQIEEETERFKTTSPTYKIGISHKERLHKQEKDLLKESSALIADTELWKWCLAVRGLGEVAGMTFVGYINPRKYRSINAMWSMLGLSPTSILKKGQQAKFNPQLKGRFLGVITQNIIRSADPYYSEVYRIKKMYYTQRPDLIDILEKKPRGWKARIHKMSIRILGKLLVSHAYDILKCDMGITKAVVIDHRNAIPLKPQDPIEQKKILTAYAYNHAKFLEKLKLAWKNDGSEGHAKYFEYLRHGELNSSLGDELGL